MAASTVTVFGVDTSDGSNILPALTTGSTDNNGGISVSIVPQSSPVRVTVSGGSFDSEMNSSTISSPGTISLLLASGNTNATGISVNPLSTMIDSRTLGLLHGGGTTFATALSSATTQIEQTYALSSDPGTLTPDYTTTGSDSANLGLILGAIINEDQYMCPASPGGLAPALAEDLYDGIFDGQGSSGAVAYCGGNLPAISGSTDFQDALSGLAQLQNVTAAFAFGGTGNILSINGLADIALNGSNIYPSAPLETIDSAVPLAAPSPVNTFASSGSTASMNTARESATATLLPNGRVLIAGGISGGTFFSSTELYDPTANTFAGSGSTATMNSARELAPATLLPNGKLLIAGGLGGAPLSSTELYDPANNTFAAPGSTASMNIARGAATATLLPNGKVLIAGGIQGLPLKSTELYDPSNNAFAPPAATASMNGVRQFATATLLPNGKVLIAGGGASAGPAALRTTELYDPATNTFAASGATANMNVARLHATATLLPNGKVLIAGGQNSGIILSSTELYDPATNTFAAPGATAVMNAIRTSATATLLPNGKVLIAGGLGQGGRLTTTELYDPATNTFAAPGSTASMNGGRQAATATLLPNGKVLIAGGFSNSGDLSSTDLYTP